MSSGFSWEKQRKVVCPGCDKKVYWFETNTFEGMKLCKSCLTKAKLLFSFERNKSLGLTKSGSPKKIYMRYLNRNMAESPRVWLKKMFGAVHVFNPGFIADRVKREPSKNQLDLDLVIGEVSSLGEK